MEVRRVAAVADEHHGLPDLALRTNEPTWQTLMGDWFQRVMFEMAEFLAPLGGPIVLTQVENELAYDAPVEYVQWAGLMARDAVAKAANILLRVVDSI